MDGYTFMLERNRRLIRHEADLQRQPPTLSEAGDGEKSLREDLLALYQGLEGCGRGETEGMDVPPNKT